MICLGTKFKVAPSNGLGGDSFTRNVMDGRTHVRADRHTDGQTMVKLWYEINILFFSNEKSGYNKRKVFQSNMSKNTVDGNCMTKKMLVVICSTNPEIREKKYTNVYKKSIKNILFFFVFDRFRTCDLRFFI